MIVSSNDCCRVWTAQSATTLVFQMAPSTQYGCGSLSETRAWNAATAGAVGGPAAGGPAGRGDALPPLLPVRRRFEVLGPGARAGAGAGAGAGARRVWALTAATAPAPAQRTKR